MKKTILILLVAFILAGCKQTNTANFGLSNLIGKGMVLQRNSEVALWGTGSPGLKVEISSTWGVRIVTKTDRTGHWQLNLKTPDAGGPFQLAFKTRDTSLVISDVYIGEVWLCSGQSNMEMPLSGFLPNDTVNNHKAEIEAANYPAIHFYTVTRKVSTTPETEVSGNWQVCSPATAAGLSATAYFFGRELNRKLNIPIGLIVSSWGGTRAESWMSADELKSIQGYSGLIQKITNSPKQLDTLNVWLGQLRQSPIDESIPDIFNTLDYRDESYSKLEYNDSLWPKAKIAQGWERNGLPGFDGAVWYRKEFTVPANMLDKDLILHLGSIDDMDKTFLNGDSIGGAMLPGFWNVERNYTLPSKLLRKGKNQIAIRVLDQRGGGGFTSGLPIYLSEVKHPENRIEIDGLWKFLPTAEYLNGTLYYYSEWNDYFEHRPNTDFIAGPNSPTTLYNGMIHPIVPYTLAGIIWYQGESDVDYPDAYTDIFSTLIHSWRKEWGNDDLPFYYVQIAPYVYFETKENDAAIIREVQRNTLQIPHTGMVVTSDIGSSTTIHPGNKQDVGKRLALWALAKTYGFDSITYSGPLFERLEKRGDSMVAHFQYAVGLNFKGTVPESFEIAGVDSVFLKANIQIEGNTITAFSPSVKNPVFLRYGWHRLNCGNLFNRSGLPASPFWGWIQK